MARHGGFTVIELMVAIAVLAILVALAVPNFNDATLSARLNGFANSLEATAQVARSEAIKRNETIRLCASSDGATPTCDAAEWEEGWIVVTDDDGCCSTSRPCRRSLKSPRPVALNILSFPGTVVGTTNATLTVCRSTPVGSEERLVTISGTGSAYVSITTAGILLLVSAV